MLALGGENIFDNSDLCIIIPAYQAAAFLRRLLAQLAEFGEAVPVLVVDAGSRDDTGEVARSLGAEVLRLPERQGPAAARNAGAEVVKADTLLFLDADCVPHRDVLERVRRAFRDTPDLVALTGSYDDAPPEQNFFSQYMNLRHHFTHQRARREPATFWAGCGAVRREPFLCAGGFDAERYPRPQIEDIELAARLRPFGRLRLDPNLQVTHLKRWDLRSVVQTDIVSRAIPWARLLAEQGELPNDLNLRRSQRFAAALSPFVLVTPALLAGAVWSGRGWLAALSGVILAVAVGLNLPMVAFFARKRGAAFAVGAFLFHQVHLAYSSFTFAVFLALHRRTRAQRARGARAAELDNRTNRPQN